MDIRRLRYFLSVAELGSYTRAAGQLRISQPALSRQIQALEEELGTRLLLRTGRGVKLTDTGAMLIERGHGLLRQLEQTRAEIAAQASEPAGRINLAVPPTAGSQLVPPLVQRYRAQFPRIFLQILGAFSGYIQEWLQSGRVDLGVLHNPSPMRGIVLTPLLLEQTFLVGPRDSPLGERPGATLADLERLPLILPNRSHSLRTHFEQLAARNGVRLNLVLEVDGLAIIRSLVKRGLGYSILTEGAIRDDLQHRELVAVPFLPPPGITWTLALAERTDLPRTRAVAALAQMIREVCRELIASGVWVGEPAPRTGDRPDWRP